MLQRSLEFPGQGAKAPLNEEGVTGWHVFGEVWGVSADKLSDEGYLRSLVIEAAKVANMHIVDVKTWRFTGGDKAGVSVVALVLESHIAIHTWPTYNYAAIDVYTCGSHARPWDAFDYIVKSLKPKTYTKTIVDRSSHKVSMGV